MSTEPTFGEIAHLERRLVELGRTVVEVNAKVRDAVDWFAALPAEVRSRLGVDAITTLVNAARTAIDDRARKLALGGLMLTAEEATAHPERARFTARFAAQRLSVRTGEAPLWGRIRLSPSEEEDARQLFEAARGDHSYTDDELSNAAAAFVRTHRATPGMYGRLASGLEFLAGVLTDSSTRNEHRETARAALTYFVVDADAIPDELGPVGLLDDMLIVQHAVAEINPDRAQVTELLDEIAARWPFVADVMLDSIGGSYPLSEFVVVNAALLLDGVLAEGTTGSVVVVPTVGPLPLLCGFLRAIAEIRDTSADAEDPEFSPGDRLRNRTNGAEVEFVCYGRPDTTGAVQPCRREEATHFQYRTSTSNTRTQPLNVISAFMRSPRRGGKLRRGDADFDNLAMRVGPLERLLGRTEPVVLPKDRRRVIVVMDRPEAKALASGLSVFGRSLHDVLPMSGARVGGDGYSEEPWTKSGPGGSPLLTVVGSAAEAVDLIEGENVSVAGVVTRIRPGTTDATNLVDVHARGIPVVAIVVSTDRGSHAVFEKAGMRFWVWEDRWFDALHWPTATAGNAVVDYEDWLRTLGRAEVSVLPIQMPELDEAWSCLTKLGGIRGADGDDEDGMLAGFNSAAFRLLHRIRTTVTPMDPELQRVLARGRRAVADAARVGEQWWPEDTAATANRAAAALDAAAAKLSTHNPKWEALLAWVTDNPSGTLLCKPSDGPALERAFASRSISWIPDAKAHRLAVGLVPYWRARERMDRLLHPPVASRLTLLLYGPELEWFESARSRRNRVIRQLEQITSSGSPFRPVRPRPRRDEVDSDTPSMMIGPEPDELMVAARRTLLSQFVGDDRSEAVPARLVHFAGGVWAAFSRERTVHTLTHLLGESGTEHELREKPAWDLEPGDVVVLVRGSDRDAIRSAVDEIIPEGLRELAATWRDALRRYAVGRGLDDVVARLEGAGCYRTPRTVARWLKDETMIRPRHGRADIQAIARITGDATLVERLDDCAEACDELFRLHATVGRSLTLRVFESAKDWLMAGVAPEDVVEIDDRLVIVTVEAIDSEIVAVPHALLGRLQEAAWPE